MSSMTRPIHSLLWLKKFISDAQEDTLILCGDREANQLIFPMCMDKSMADGNPLFWVPYQAASIISGNYEFKNFVVDSSWKDPTQAAVDWFEMHVMPYVSVDAKTFHVP